MTITLKFPDLASKNEQERPALEVSIDFLPEPYIGKWLKVVAGFTANWVEKHSFTKSATLWMWGSMSCNLISRHQLLPVPSWSEFIVQFGLPQTFLSELENVLAHKFDGQASITEMINFRRQDGWTAICHIENGKVWTPVDDEEWTQVQQKTS